VSFASVALIPRDPASLERLAHAHSRPQALAAFATLLHAQRAQRCDLALIAWRLSFTLGRAPYELRIVDRLVVADGLIREREAYYDSLALMFELLRRPRAWPGYWR
jgi:hypothetical protein